MTEKTDWLAYAKERLRLYNGAPDVTAIALRAYAVNDEWLRSHLIKLGAEELVRQAQARK